MDLKGHLTEYVHLAQQASTNQQTAPWAPFIGTIQSYDPLTNTVIVLDPSNSNPDLDATPIQMPPMPLATGFAGLSSGKPSPLNNAITCWGMQIAPFGGSSIAQDLQGEMVLVLPLNPDIGYCACAFLMYNNKAQPPGGSAGIPVIGGQLAGGEILYVAPSGTVVYIDKDGNIKIITQVTPNGESNKTGNLQAVSNGGISLRTAVPNTKPDDPDQYDIDISAHHDINEVATHDINMTAQEEINGTAVTDDITLTAQQTNVNLNAQQNIFLSANQDLVEEVIRDETSTVGRNWSMTAGALINISATGNIEIQSQGIIEILAPTTINAGALGETLYALCTSVFLELFNEHTHSDVMAGSDISGTPTIPIPATYPNITQVFEAG